MSRGRQIFQSIFSSVLGYSCMADFLFNNSDQTRFADVNERIKHSFPCLTFAKPECDVLQAWTAKWWGLQHIITRGLGQTLKHRKRMLYGHCYINVPTCITYKIVFTFKNFQGKKKQIKKPVTILSGVPMKYSNKLSKQSSPASRQKQNRFSTKKKGFRYVNLFVERAGERVVAFILRERSSLPCYSWGLLLSPKVI